MPGKGLETNELSDSIPNQGQILFMLNRKKALE